MRINRNSPEKRESLISADKTWSCGWANHYMKSLSLNIENQMGFFFLEEEQSFFLDKRATLQCTSKHQPSHIILEDYTHFNRNHYEEQIHVCSNPSMGPTSKPLLYVDDHEEHLNHYKSISYKFRSRITLHFQDLAAILPSSIPVLLPVS